MKQEKDIEAYLVRRVKELGGVAFKFVSPGHAGAPDRLVCLPGGRVRFVELKAPGQTPRPLQKAVLTKLRRLGLEADVVDSRAGVDALLGRDLELRPCPVCGGAPRVTDWECAWEYGTTVQCCACGCFVCEGVEDGNGWHERAVTRWNCGEVIR